MQMPHGRASGPQQDLSARGRAQGGSPPEPEAAAAGDRHERECPQHMQPISATSWCSPACGARLTPAHHQCNCLCLQHCASAQAAAVLGAGMQTAAFSVMPGLHPAPLHVHWQQSAACICKALAL